MPSALGRPGGGRDAFGAAPAPPLRRPVAAFGGRLSPANALRHRGLGAIFGSLADGHANHGLAVGVRFPLLCDDFGGFPRVVVPAGRPQGCEVPAEAVDDACRVRTGRERISMGTRWS